MAAHGSTRIGLKALGVLAAAAALSSCQTLPTLPGGGASAMAEESNRLRSGLAIAAVPLPRRLGYAAVRGCSYRVETELLDSKMVTEQQQELTIRPVRDRLLVTVTGASTVTALIGRDGQLFDFNMVAADGTRTSADTFASAAAQQAEQLRAAGHAGVRVINDIAVAFPHFRDDRRNVGDAVAVIDDETGKPWASYVYRGTATYGGTEAAVLDLVRITDSAPMLGLVTVGFSLVDLELGIPLLYVLDAGSRTRSQRVSCR